MDNERFFNPQAKAEAPAEPTRYFRVNEQKDIEDAQLRAVTRIMKDKTAAEAAQAIKVAELNPDIKDPMYFLRNPDLTAQVAEVMQAKTREDLAPIARRYLTNPELQPLIQADLDKLGTIERIKLDTQQYWEHGARIRKQSDIGWRALMGEELTDEDRQFLARDPGLIDYGLGFTGGIPGAVGEQAQIMYGMVEEGLIGAAAGAGAGAVYGLGVGALVVPGAGAVFAAPGAAAGATLGATLGMAYGAGKMEAALAYIDYSTMVDETGTPIPADAARMAALLVGAANGGAEMVGLKWLVKGVPGGDALMAKLTRTTLDKTLKTARGRQLLRRLAAATGRTGINVTGEIATEIFQELTTYLGGELLAGAYDTVDPTTGKVHEPFSNLDELGAAIGHVAYRTAQATIGISGTVEVGRTALQIREAGIHERRLQELKQQLEAAAASQLREASPPRFRNYIEELFQDAPANVYADAEVVQRLFQNFTPEEVAQTLPELAQELEDAKQTGAPVAIPMEDLLTYISALEGAQEFLQDVRFSPKGKTMREQKAEIVQGSEALRETLAALSAETVETAPEFEVYRRYKAQLELHYSPEIAEANALLMQEHANTQGPEQGMTPVEYYEWANASVSPPAGQGPAPGVQRLHQRTHEGPPRRTEDGTPVYWEPDPFPEVDDTPAAGRRRTPPGVPAPLVETADLANALDVASASKFDQLRDFKQRLQELVREAAAGRDLSAYNQENFDYLVTVALRDAQRALKSNPDAVGWYDKTVAKALRVLAVIHPELDTDPAARVAFMWALAVTSNGMRVERNFALAEVAYRQWRATGVMPDNVGEGPTKAAINQSLALYNVMAERYTPETLQRFMVTAFTANTIEKGLGWSASGENAATVVLGAIVLGPKIGNGFYANLNGIFDQLTMDRWLIRTWGRWTGTLLVDSPENRANARARMRAAIEAMTADEITEYEALIGIKLDANPDEVGIAIKKASGNATKRDKMNALSEELRKAGNSLWNWLDGQKESPQNGVERNWIRKVMWAVHAELVKDNPDLTMADLQALLWYAEKRLYDASKVEDATKEGYEPDEAPDYANAAITLARDQGVPEDVIQEAASRPVPGRDRQADQPPIADAGRRSTRTHGLDARARRQFLINHLYIPTRVSRAGNGKVWGYGRGRTGSNRGIRGLIYSPKAPLTTITEQIGITAPVMMELTAGYKRLKDGERESAVATFHSIMQKVKADSKYGAAVYVYTPEEYSQMRLFLSEDHKSGFAIKEDGDIVSVFSSGGQAAYSMLVLATNLGGTKLDAFETVLPEIYEVAGFREIDRVQWADEYMPPDWDKGTFAPWNNGEPDVVFMEYDPTYAPAEPVQGDPRRLYQNNMDPRGYLDVGADRKFFKITLTGKANSSTFVHEAGHLFLELLLKAEAEGIASARQLNDLAQLRQLLDFTTDPDVEVHERFARSFEAYLREGRAPSAELAGVFASFRTWLIHVYRSIKRLLGQDELLTDDLREVFDRLLAADDKIIEYRAREKVEPLPVGDAITSDEIAGLAALFQKQVDEAHRRAGERAQQALVAQVRREYKERKEALTAQYRAALEQMPIYTAIEWFRNGKADNLPEDVRKLRLDLDEVRSVLGVDKLPKRMRGMTGPDTMSADGWAGLFNLPDGRALLEGLRDLDPIAQTVQRAVKAKLAEEFDGLDISNPAEMQQMAADAWNGNASIEYLERVLASVSRQLGEQYPVSAAQATRQLAEQKVANTPLRRLTPARYEAAVNKLRIKAAEAAKAGNWASVRTAVLQMLYNENLYKASREAIDEHEKLRKGLQRYNRTDVLGRLGKVTVEHNGETRRPARDGVMLLMAALELKKETWKTLDNRQRSILSADHMQRVKENADLLQAMDPQLVVYLTDDLITGQVRNVRELSLQELRDYRDAIESFAHAGRKLNEVRIGQERQDLAVVVDAIVTSMTLNKAGSRKTATVGSADMPTTVLDKAGEALRGAADTMLASLLKMEFQFEDMDGGKDRTHVGPVMGPDGRWERDAAGTVLLHPGQRGPASRALFDPFSAAQRSNWDLKQKMGRELKAIYDKYRGRDPRWDARMDEVVDVLGYRGFTRRDLIALTLNMGSDSNRHKMITGFNDYLTDKLAMPLDETTLEGILERELRPQDFEMVNELWAWVGQLWPQIAQTFEEASGLKPPKIQAKPFKLNGVQLTGGYYPIAYNFDLMDNAKLQIVNAAKNEAGAVFEAPLVRKNVSKGFTESRTNFTAPIRTDLGVLSEHVTETIDYVTYYPPIASAWRIINNNKFRKAFVEHYGDMRYKELTKWLQGIANDGRAPDANGGARGLINAVLGKTNPMATVSTFGLSVQTVLTQITGWLTVVHRIGPVHASWGLARMVKDLKPGPSDAMLRSFELQPLMTGMDQQMREINRTAFDPRNTAWQARKVKISNLLFAPMARLQTLVNIAAFYGGLHQAEQMGLTGDAATHHADAVVRLTQSAAGPKDLSEVQRRDNVYRALAFAMSWFNVMFGIQYQQSRRVQRAAEKGGFGAALATGTAALSSYLAYVALGPSLAAQWLRSTEDEWDEIDWAEWLKVEGINAAVGGIPIVRSLGQVAAGYDADPMGASMAQIENAYKGVGVLWDWANDEVDLSSLTETQIKQLLTLPAIFVPLPTAQMSRTLAGWDEGGWAIAVGPTK